MNWEERRALAMSQVPIEPPKTEKRKVRARLRMPDGKTETRYWHLDNTMADLYNYAISLGVQLDGEEQEHFIICTNFPKQVFENSDQTLENVGLKGSVSLFVEIKLE